MIKVQIYYLFIIISHLITGAKVLLFSPNTKNGLALICKNLLTTSNPQPIGFREILLVKRQKFILLYIFLA